MKKLVLATRNKNKVRELAQILAGTQLEVLCAADFEDLEDVEETGTTFEQNALLKARYVAANTKMYALADDSGLEVKALNGQPGVYSARFAGEPANDQANIEKLLRELDGNTERSARFACVMALVGPDGETIACERGICSGVITQQASGDKGFGYDPVFMPEGCSVTFAQMSAEEKNSMSHRARALEAMKKHLEKI